MLAEYAIVPDVFDPKCYSQSGFCHVYLQNIKPFLLEEALVRDLRGGEWRSFIKNEMQRWDPRAKELIKKLDRQNRLRLSKPAPTMTKTPRNYLDWLNEARISHEREQLTGIIISSQTEKELEKRETIASSIEKLSNAQWWQHPNPSRKLRRNTDDYLKHLRLILSHANSIMFIDPHLDPSKKHYKEFVQLLRATHRSDISPQIEIHRKCFFWRQGKRIEPSNDEWEKIFHNGLQEDLSRAGLVVDVFIWSDIHDRYLITDLIGISLPNGFDVSGSENFTTWTRLSRKDRDYWQREFDPQVRPGKFKGKFQVGRKK